MKKFIVMFFCLIAMVCLASCSNAMADNSSSNNEEENVKINEWYDVCFEADELKGEDACTMHCYRNDDGEFSMDDDYNHSFVLCTFDGIFDTNYCYGERIIKNAVVGLYDKNGKLLEKFSNFKMFVSDSGFAGTKNKKIKEFIKTKKGYVRFVISRYARSDFDMKIPCINN